MQQNFFLTLRFRFYISFVLVVQANSFGKLVLMKVYLRIKFEMLWHFQLTGHKQFSILKVPFSSQSHNLSGNNPNTKYCED